MLIKSYARVGARAADTDTLIVLATLVVNDVTEYLYRSFPTYVNYNPPSSRLWSDRVIVEVMVNIVVSAEVLSGLSL